MTTGIKTMDIKSDFAILDVKKGRKRLRKHFELCGPPIKINLAAEIVGTWGGDDGTSQEFELRIITVQNFEDQ